VALNSCGSVSGEVGGILVVVGVRATLLRRDVAMRMTELQTRSPKVFSKTVRPPGELDGHLVIGLIPRLDLPKLRLFPLEHLSSSLAGNWQKTIAGSEPIFRHE
jgi:hypothetical protein